METGKYYGELLCIIRYWVSRTDTAAHSDQQHWARATRVAGRPEETQTLDETHQDTHTH